jgi:hypothetical protein
MHSSAQVEGGQVKPKASIPLKRIACVSEIMAEDKKKFKKLDKAPDIAFKVGKLVLSFLLNFLLDPLQ